jgi:hypothetical protein
MWRVRTTNVVVEKSMNITQTLCVFVALGIQHAMRMRHIVICDLPRPTNVLSILSHKWHNFRKKSQDIKSMFRISLKHLSEIFSILRRTERDMV